MGKIPKRRESKKDVLKTTKTGEKRKLKLNRALLDDDMFHPIKKAPRKVRSAPVLAELAKTAENEPDVAQKLEEPLEPATDSKHQSSGEQPNLFLPPPEPALAGFESPRKAARAPFCGIQPSYVSAYDKSPTTVPCSPSTVLSRPLRRTISGFCIRQLAETDISPQKKPFLSQGSIEEGGEEGKEEEGESEEPKEAFADETEKAAKALARKSTANFVRINIRKKRFVPKSQQKSQFQRKRMNWKFRGAGRRF